MTTRSRSRGTPAIGGNDGPWVVRGNLERDKKALAHDIIDYLSNLTVTQGRLTGSSFTVLRWQQRFILAAFLDGTTSAAISVARGNGKTSFLSGIAAATLNGPLAVPRGETVLVASSFEQARIAFEHVLAFMGDELKDRERWRVWDTGQQARIEDRKTLARVRCVGSDPRRAHGLAPVLTLADEPAQWPETTSERMRSALMTAAGKQPHSRFVALGTRPADESHWFAKMLDDGGCDYAQTHAARSGDPKWQRRTWARANPSLQHFPDLEAAIRREASGAKRDPSLLSAFDALRLNLGTSDVARATLLDVATWRSIEGEAEPIGKCYWGLDLGTSAAMSAVAAFFPASGRLEVLCAFPTEPSLADRGVADGVDRLYAEGARRGEIICTGGNAVALGPLIEEAQARFGVPAAIAADRWREAELRDTLKAVGFPMTALELRGQGFKDGSEDVRAFRRACLEGDVTPIPSLILTAAMGEARVIMDPAGNSKLSKSSQGGRRLRARDDSAAAAILAVALASRRYRRSSKPNRLMLGVIG